MTTEAKCNCQYCSGHVSFPAEMAGQMAECPHCHLETRLFIPPPAASPMPKPSIGPQAVPPPANTESIPEARPPKPGAWKIAGGILAVIATVCLVKLCLNTMQPAPVEWDYETFEKKYSIITTDTDGKRWQPVVFVSYYRPGELDPYRRNTNECYGVQDILRVAGNCGWEYAGFDGEIYIIKRASTTAHRSRLSITIAPYHPSAAR